MCVLCCVCFFFFLCVCVCVLCCFFFFQAEDGIRYLVRSRGLGDVYKRQDVLRPVGRELDRLEDPARVIARDSILWDVFRQYLSLIHI